MKEISDYINESVRQAEQSAKFRTLAQQGEGFKANSLAFKQALLLFQNSTLLSMVHHHSLANH